MAGAMPGTILHGQSFLGRGVCTGVYNIDLPAYRVI